jgi:hypothetical protein
MAKMGRRNAINSAILNTKIMVLVDKLVQALEKDVAASITTNTPIPREEIRRWVSTLALVTQRTQQIMREALTIERVVAGDPIAVLGVRVDQMSPEDTLATLQDIARSFGVTQSPGEKKAMDDLAALERQRAEAREKQRN